MTVETQTEPGRISHGWDDATHALLVGIAVFGGMVFHVAVNQPPGLAAPPVEIIPLLVFNTAAAVISYLLLRRHNRWGYVAALVTGVLIVLSIVLIATGTVGNLPSGANPIGPLAYAGLGVAVFVTAVLAWRKASRVGRSVASRPAGE